MKNNSIKNFRTFLGVSQKQFAHLVSRRGKHKVTQTAVSNWENGFRTPKPAIAMQITKLAHKEDYILSLDDIYIEAD